jgi:hypothetical protein
MKRSTVDLKTALQMRKVFIIVFLILCFIIAGIATTKAAGLSSRVHDRYTIIKKQNKVYANACALLKEKRNKKEKAKSHKGKYR